MAQVLTPAGASWVVRRRLKPWRIRNRVPTDLAPLVLLPVSGLLMALEGLVAVLVHPVLLLSRRRWTVEAERVRTPTRAGELVRWSVSGRPGTRRRVQEVVAALESGGPLPDGGVDVPVG